MASAIQMPKLSDTMTEGVIQKWLVKEGDTVKAGDPLAEVETDKATLEMEAYESGTLLKILAEPGKPTPVGATLAVIGKPGEDWTTVGGKPKASVATPPPAPAAPSAQAPAAAQGPTGGKATAVLMPKLSDTMTEGVVQKWLVKEGDAVKAGDPLAEVETDKATLEMEAYDGGTVLKIVAQPGVPAKVGATLAVIGVPGADWRSAVVAAPAEAAPAAAAAPAPKAAAAPAPARVSAPRPASGPASYPARTSPGEIPGLTYGFGSTLAPPVPRAPRTASGEKLRASPLARRIASDRGIDLLALEGSGPGGRIVRQDVEQAQPGKVVGRIAPKGPVPEADTLQMSQMRKAIARNLVQVKQTVPHFYLTIDVDMTQALALRAQAKVAELPISVNDLILKAVAIAALKVPRVQAQLVDENTVKIPHEVNLGMAVALDDGLVTPVIRGADRLTVAEIGAAARDLATRARDRKLDPSAYAGGTITLSNLGMFDIEHFYAIINPGQASIVSVGAARQEPVVKDGQLAIGSRMRVSYAGNHRVVDGAVGARFLQELKKVLENPLQMFVG